MRVIKKSRMLEHYLHLEGWYKFEDGVYVSIWAYKIAFSRSPNKPEINCEEGKEMVENNARHRKVPFTYSEKYPDGNAYFFDDIQKYYSRQ